MRSDIIFHFVCVLFLIVIISVQANAQNEQWAEDGQGGFILSRKREASGTSGRRRNHRLLRNLQRVSKLYEHVHKSSNFTFKK